MRLATKQQEMQDLVVRNPFNSNYAHVCNCICVVSGGGGGGHVNNYQCCMSLWTEYLTPLIQYQSVIISPFPFHAHMYFSLRFSRVTT